MYAMIAALEITNCAVCCHSALSSLKLISGSVFEIENVDKCAHDQIDGRGHDQKDGQTPISKAT